MTNDYGRAIGRIEGKLDRLLDDIAKSEKQQTELHLSVENLKEKFAETDYQIHAILAKIQKVQKPILDFSRWRERFTGAVMLASFIAASLGGTLVLSWQKLAEALKMAL